MAKRRISPTSKKTPLPSEALSRAEQFLCDSLKFLKQSSGEWLRLASIDPDRMVAECETILQSQERAKRQFVFKMATLRERPELR